MTNQTHDQLTPGWYLEDRVTGQLLPAGPFASLSEAQVCAAEIECGRPVQVINPKERVYQDNPEPQEMTLGRLRRPDHA